MSIFSGYDLGRSQVTSRRTSHRLVHGGVKWLLSVGTGPGGLSLLSWLALAMTSLDWKLYRYMRLGRYGYPRWAYVWNTGVMMVLAGALVGIHLTLAPPVSMCRKLTKRTVCSTIGS